MVWGTVNNSDFMVHESHFSERYICKRLYTRSRPNCRPETNVPVIKCYQQMSVMLNVCICDQECVDSALKSACVWSTAAGRKQITQLSRLKDSFPLVHCVYAPKCVTPGNQLLSRWPRLKLLCDLMTVEALLVLLCTCVKETTQSWCCELLCAHVPAAASQRARLCDSNIFNYGVLYITWLMRPIDLYFKSYFSCSTVVSYSRL